jgi:chain length determinant protein EpsF
MTLRQILVILRAQRRLALAVFGGTVVAAMLITLAFPREYTAAASVVVDVKGDPLSTALISEDAILSYMGTQVEIAGSERVAQRVIKALDFDAQPEFRTKWLRKTGGRGDYEPWLARLLLKKVTIKPTPLSNVIEISVNWTDAKTAARIANAFAQAYIDTNIALKMQMAKQFASGFEERERTLRAALQAKQKALSDFENQSGIIGTDDRLDVETARLNELSTQLVTIQEQRQDSQSRRRRAGEDSQAVPEVIQNSLVSSLKGDLSKAEARLKDLETTLGVNHPAYRSALAEVTSLRGRLQAESAVIVSSFDSATRVNLNREKAVSDALDAQKTRILELKHQRDQLAVLQNDVATAQRNLDAVSQRLAQSDLEGSTDHTNIGLLTAATEAGVYSTPRYGLILALAAALGAFLAVAAALGVELADQRVRTDDDVLHVMGVPVFGVIGPIVYPPRAPTGPGDDLPRLESSAI